MQKLFDKSVILAILIVLIISTTGIFDTLNYFIYDNYIVLNQKKTICPEIVIVDIDSKTLKAFAYWPFRRSVYSQILQKVINASPKVIGIDLYFNTTQRNKIEDEKLHSILKTFKNIVISSRFEYRTVNTIKVMVPEDSLFPDITRGHVLLSEKKVIRSFPPFKVIPAFSLQVLKLYYQNKLPIKLKNLLTYQNSHNYSISKDILIDFKRPISQFKHISFIDIYNNKDNLEELKNKIVLIGVSDTNLTPFYSTPFNINNKELSVPSVELQAQIIDSFINYSGLRAIPDVLVFIISAIIASLFYYLSKGKSIFMQGAVFILSMIIVIIIDYVIFKYLNLWFPPVILISILILIFSFYIYSTINKIDRSIVKTIEELNKDENLFLERLPAEVIDKVEFFERLVGTISQDRNIIKSIINGINNGIIVFDKEEKIIWANSLILKLFQNSLVLNNSIRELISEIDFDKAIELVDEKGVFRQELILKEYHFQMFINKISDKNENYIILFNDISELKKAEMLKSDMVRMLSHEIKNPVNNISIVTENVMDFATTDFLKKNFQILQESTNTIFNIINDFLSLNKLESTLTQLNLTEINIIELLIESIELQSVNANNKNIKILLECEYQKINIHVDKKLILILFNNLILNALKYSYDNSTITVKVISLDDKVQILVIDNGIGIPGHELNKIFNKFYRASNNSEINVSGTGLGLSIVKKIASMHNGLIEVESEYKKGTTFTFTLLKN